MKEINKHSKKPCSAHHKFRPLAEREQEGPPLVTARDGVSDKKYERLLAAAGIDGRLNGLHVCSTCGMRFHSRREADECCRIGQ
jgi:hypothetical protein